jgi:hypothetical protein
MLAAIYRPMNKLILGLNDKRELLDTKPGFLVIDDGPLGDKFLKRFKRAKVFDPHKHSFNPLDGIDNKKARELAEIFYGSEGKETLTVRNGKRALTRLLPTANRLDRVKFGKGDDDKEAKALIDDMLLSPVLRNVLCRATNFTFREGRSSVVARINRAELGEFDAFILGSLLVTQFPGPVIISDFGFYARPMYARLVREKRLAVAVHALAELEPKMRQMCLLMETKVGRGCTYEDAERLAMYQGQVPGVGDYWAVVNDLMAA